MSNDEFCKEQTFYLVDVNGKYRNFIEVTNAHYQNFVNWAKENIEGYRYEVIAMADRTIIRNVNDEMIAHRDCGYIEAFRIREDVMKMFVNA